MACHEGDAEPARRIVDEHPDIVAQLSDADAAALGDDAWAPNVPAVRLMLQLGSDPAAGDSGQSALHRGAWAGSPEVVESILATESGLALLEVRDGVFGGTPLGWCCHGSVNNCIPATNHAEVARLLIAAGALVPDDMEGSETVQVVLDAR